MWRTASPSGPVWPTMWLWPKCRFCRRPHRSALALRTRSLCTTSCRTPPFLDSRSLCRPALPTPSSWHRPAPVTKSASSFTHRDAKTRCLGSGFAMFLAVRMALSRSIACGRWLFRRAGAGRRRLRRADRVDHFGGHKGRGRNHRLRDGASNPRSRPQGSAARGHTQKRGQAKDGSARNPAGRYRTRWQLHRGALCEALTGLETAGRLSQISVIRVP